MKVSIVPVRGTADLLCVYGGQSRPQDCYVALDTRDGQFFADYNGEVGNAVPADVWHGIVRRWAIPPLSAAGANALLADLAPAAERVLAGAEVRWNGSNHVGVLDEDADVANAEIAEACASVEGDLYYEDPDEWFDEVRDEIAARAATEDLDTLAEELDGDGSQDQPVLIGLVGYLERLRDEARTGERV